MVTEQEFEAAALKIQERMRYKILVLMGNREDAEDAIQNGLLKAWARRDQWRRDNDLFSWIWTVVWTQGLLMIRNRKSRMRRDAMACKLAETLAPPADRQFAEQERLRLMREALALLPTDAVLSHFPLDLGRALLPIERIRRYHARGKAAKLAETVPELGARVREVFG
jgi:DNA-directed RNA polymerase specialized sigma24 family protein